jgi:hypothetical protein
MSTTVVTVDVGGTGANNAAEARANLGVRQFNFVNTGTVQVTVTETTAGNANISFTAADAGFNPFFLAGM